MGIEIWSFRSFMEHRNRIRGDLLMLGRQEVHLIGPLYNMESRIKECLVKYGADDTIDPEAFSGFGEGLFRWLGASTVESLDFAPFEGASIIHDLNVPVGDELKGRFDVIYDGATIEHVYHFPNAVESVKKMLRPGGLFISINAANNFLGHGFYQFSPELMWRVFGAEGFRVLSIRLITDLDNFQDMPDPEALGGRQEIGRTPGGAYIFVVAEKIADVDKAKVLQSDYVTAWNKDP